MQNLRPVRRPAHKHGRIFSHKRLVCLIFAALFFVVPASPHACFAAQVTIAWDPNTEPEVAGYRLHYGSSSGNYDGYSDAGMQTVCTLSGLQVGSTYVFAATAYDAYGNQSQYSAEITYTIPSANQDQSITIGLQAGWNLLSLPFQLANPSISAVLAPIAGTCTIVWTYRNGQWLWYAPETAGNTLQAIDAGPAYWVRMAAPAQLIVSGTAGAKTTNLVRGWNFVGYSGSTPAEISTTLSSIAGKYSAVWAYEDGQWRYYDPSDPEGSSLTQLQPGKGYWIKMSEAALWTLP